MAEVRLQADQKQLSQELCVDEAPPTLIADPVRLKQILLNLLSNAVKFTPDGGRITVTARRVSSFESLVSSSQPETRNPKPETPKSPEFVEISVADTGMGIKPDDLPRLFQEFVRLDAAMVKHIPGTGLGLALTKKLVELHGGEIAAASDGEGRGSVFTVRFPLAPSQ
ncbi:MAG: hypothetical protein K8F29_03525 [Kofleriaceae bacterium]|nr:hypothetical protein [Candidatus Methylomirabilis lanthanidiphila]